MTKLMYDEQGKLIIPLFEELVQANNNADHPVYHVKIRSLISPNGRFYDGDENTGVPYYEGEVEVYVDGKKVGSTGHAASYALSEYHGDTLNIIFDALGINTEDDDEPFNIMDAALDEIHADVDDNVEFDIEPLYMKITNMRETEE